MIIEGPRESDVPQPQRCPKENGGPRPAAPDIELFTADQTRRSTSIFLISPIALAGFRPFGQVCAQFMIVWQR